MDLEKIVLHIDQYLYKDQNKLFKRNKEFRESHTFAVDSYDEFKKKIEQGFVMAHRDGTIETAEKIQKETAATIRCIPFNKAEKEGKCIVSGEPSPRRVLFAKSY